MSGVIVSVAVIVAVLDSVVIVGYAPAALAAAIQ